MRVLLETNILVRAAKPGSGPARELLSIAIRDRHVIVCSDFILAQRKRLPSMTTERPTVTMETLESTKHSYPASLTDAFNIKSSMRLLGVEPVPQTLGEHCLYLFETLSNLQPH